MPCLVGRRVELVHAKFFVNRVPNFSVVRCRGIPEQRRPVVSEGADAAHAELYDEAQQAIDADQLRSQAAIVLATEQQQLRDALAQRDHNLQQEHKFAAVHQQLGEQFADINLRF